MNDCLLCLIYTLQIDVRAAVICVIASQIANLGESLIGASLQEKEGFLWVSLVRHLGSVFNFLVIKFPRRLGWLT